MSPLIHCEFLNADQMDVRAAELRDEVGLTSIPVDPFAIAAALDVDVIRGSFQDDSIEGVFRIQGGRPQILISGSFPLVRQKFTVAHELGHFRLHWETDGRDSDTDRELFVDDDLRLYRRGTDQGASARDDRNREIQANMFASALLMPKEQVIRYAADMRSVRVLARVFGVSELAMRYRIGELDVW